MSSLFSWVDFSEDDRHRMMEILHLFRDREIREELGVGTVRDAFSEILFPGTSTLHTRAKYMLFIPWIFLKLEGNKTSSKKMEENSRWYEIRLIKSLLDAKESEGVIGRVAKDTLKILPSTMYWSGLGRWDIRRYEGTKYQYFKSLDHFYVSQKKSIKSGYSEFLSQIGHNWDPHIVPFPKDFPNNTKLNLNQKEAEYLHHRISTSCSDSLLAFLVNKTKPVDADFIWFHPEFGSFREEHKKIINHARNFSDTFYGASLLYNLMLAQKANMEEKISEYSDKIGDWILLMENRSNEIRAWDLKEFWNIVYSENSRINRLTYRFIEKWIELVRSYSDLSKLANDEKARLLIYRRELRLKGKRSRLKNPRMLAQWLGASGAFAFSFRWQIARRIIRDIYQGMRSRKS